MRKKILGALAAAGLLAGLLGLAMPSPASAQVGNAAGVAVFLGGANTPGGLCLPGLTSNGTACVVAPPGGNSGAWSFNSTTPASTPAGNIPPQCIAVGAFGLPGANPVADADCDFSVAGSLGGVTPLMGATCGSSAGWNGDGTFTAGANTLGLADLGWISSAGGTIPVFGSAGGNQLVGLVQARPLQGPTSCVLVPATSFTVVGVTAIVPVAAQITCAGGTPACS